MCRNTGFANALLIILETKLRRIAKIQIRHHLIKSPLMVNVMQSMSQIDQENVSVKY